MATIEDTPTNWRRYTELRALEIVMTSDYALGEVFAEVLEAIDLEQGLDLATPDRPGLYDLFAALVPDDGPDLLHDVENDLLIARLLRSITPEVVDRSASYFEGLAAEKIADATRAVTA